MTMKFRLWKLNSSNKWIFFNAVFDDTDKNSLDYQRAVRLIQKGWQAYPEITTKQKQGNIPLVPTFMNPIVIDTVDYSRLEQAIRDDNPVGYTIGRCMSEFLSKQRTQAQIEKSYVCQSPEVKQAIANQAFDYWLREYQANRFVPNYILKQILA